MITPTTVEPSPMFVVMQQNLKRFCLHVLCNIIIHAVAGYRTITV